MDILKLFKKKSEVLKDDLEKAKVLKLITEEEFLELKVERAKKELKDFLNKKNLKRGASR